jgi:hypothetical protein
VPQPESSSSEVTSRSFSALGSSVAMRIGGSADTEREAGASSWRCFHPR